MRTNSHAVDRQPIDVRVVAGLVSVKLAVHLAVLGRYDTHVDELYFLACGRHLAFGYVDHGPFVPWMARISSALFGDSAAGLRIVPALVGASIVALTILVTAQLGGRTWAQLCAGTAVLVAPVYLRAGSLLSLPSFEPLFWTLASLLVVLAIEKEEKLWLVAGGVAGVGLLNKHTMLVWGAGIVLGLLLTEQRRVLARSWPWLGGLIAFAVFSPNLWWQMRHDWATLEFLRNIRHSMLDEIPRLLFVLGQVLYQHPLVLPLWLLGVVYLFWSRRFGRESNDLRYLGWAFVFAFVLFLANKGKPYYLAPSYPIVLAAGAVALEHRWRRRFHRFTYVALLWLTSVPIALFSLPVLDLEKADRWLGRVVAPVLEDPADLSGEFHYQYGWRELAEEVSRHAREATPGEGDRLVILTRTYGQAAAIEAFSTASSEMPVASGHMSYFFWGPPDATNAVVLVVGFEPGQLGSMCREIELLARFTHPLSPREEKELPILLCRGDGRSFEQLWPGLENFDHRRRSSLP